MHQFGPSFLQVCFVLRKILKHLVLFFSGNYIDRYYRGQRDAHTTCVVLYRVEQTRYHDMLTHYYTELLQQENFASGMQNNNRQ